MATIKVKRKVNSDTAGSLSHGELGISQTKLWYGNQAGAAIEVAQKDLSLQVSTYPGAYNPVSGDILKYGAYGWGTLTLAEAGISASDHTHTLDAVTDIGSTTTNGVTTSAYNMGTTSATTTKATMQYNATTQSIEFIFA